MRVKVKGDDDNGGCGGVDGNGGDGSGGDVDKRLTVMMTKSLLEMIMLTILIVMVAMIKDGCDGDASGGNSFDGNVDEC